MPKQMVFLLVGGDENQKNEVSQCLAEKHKLTNVYDLNDPIKQLLNNVFDMRYDLFEEKNLDKKMNKMNVTAPQIGKVLGYLRRKLPENHPFNPLKISMSFVKLRFFDSVRHAIYEIDDKMIQKFVPDFCHALTYCNFAGQGGFYLVTSVRKHCDVDVAKEYFSNVFSIKIPSKVDKQFEGYQSEIESSQIKANYELKGKDIAKEIDEIMEKVKTVAKDEMIKENFKFRNRREEQSASDLPSNSLKSGKNQRMVYEPKGQVENVKQPEWLVERS